MKHTEYKVIYLNGNETVIHSFSIIGAWAAATHFANNKAWDSRIKYITDIDHDKTYSQFQLIYQTK